MTRLVVAVAVLLGLWMVRPAQAYPEPAIVSPSWALDFTFDTPRPIAFTDVDGSTRWYWYMTYKVVNNTDEDRLLVPEITIATDTGQILPANHGVPATVFNQIKQQEGNPLLESPMEVVGEILQGEDYAKESVAIWPAFVDDVDQVTVFVAGLSGENTTIQDPATGEPVLLRRTTMLIFDTPGNHPVNPQKQPIELVEQTDVMR